MGSFNKVNYWLNSAAIWANHAPLFTFSALFRERAHILRRDIEKLLRNSLEIGRKVESKGKNNINCVSFQRLKLVCIMKYEHGDLEFTKSII